MDYTIYVLERVINNFHSVRKIHENQTKGNCRKKCTKQSEMVFFAVLALRAPFIVLALETFDIYSTGNYFCIHFYNITKPNESSEPLDLDKLKSIQ